MKKTVILVLAAALLLAALCGCDRSGGTPSASPSPSASASPAPGGSDAPPAEEAPQGTADLDAQSFAASMACWLSGYTEGSDLNDDLLMWDMAGWYAAWLYRTQGVDILSAAQTADVLAAFGFTGAVQLPPSWEETGVAETLHGSDGSVSYNFRQHKLEIDEMLGVNTEVSTEALSGTASRATVTYHYEDGSSDDFVAEFTFEKNPDANSSFPYRLTGAEVLDGMEPGTAHSLPFTMDDLLEANDLKSVLAEFSSVKMLHPDDDPETASEVYAFTSGGELSLVITGPAYSYGVHRGFRFERYIDEDGNLVSFIGGSADDPWEEASDVLNGYLQEVNEISLDRVEDGVIWLNCTTWYDDFEKKIAIDRDSLRMLQDVSTYEGNTVTTQIEYSNQVPEIDFLKDWDSGTRTVTIHWDSFVDGENVKRTETVEAPAAWEYVPYEGIWGDYTVYMDEGFTQPYEYPGPGVDYTIYVTASKG